MPIERIGPDEHVRLRFDAPTTRRKVQVLVESERRISVYAVTARGLRQFNGGEDFELYDETKGRTAILEFTPDPGQPWYLLLVNDSTTDVVAYYDVKW